MRLWLVVGALALMPLLVGGLFASLLVPNVLDGENERRTQSLSAAVAAELRSACRLAGSSARALALDAGSAEKPADALGRAVDGGMAYAALVAGVQRVTVSAGAPPAGLTEPARAPRCSRGAAVGAVVSERVAVSAERLPGVTEAVVASPVDVAALVRLTGKDVVALLHDGAVVASSAPGSDAGLAALAGSAGSDGSARTDRLIGHLLVRDQSVPWDVLVAGEREDAARLQQAIAAAAIALALAAVLLGWWIARSLTQPLDELSEAADRVANGELDLQVPVRSVDEVGRLGHRFNDMTAKLRRTISELERSRDEMADSLARMGETLENTHDLDGLLHLVLDTAVTITGAEAGVALVLDGHGFSLVAEHAMGGPGRHAPRRVLPGAGVLGSVATAAGPVRGRLGDEEGDLRPAPEEPDTGHVLAIALRRGTKVVGLLGLYRRADSAAFSAGDEEAVRTLAGQAGIAVDNVMLHREAQRLSITDALTGLWNFRYLSMSLAREIERASRFDRQLAVLMLDLDRFKQVNDTHGHARGDAVLRELAARITEQVREVDTLARYGGEEFVLVLPETTIEGATMLAERICVAVRREPFGDMGDEPLGITVSIGVAAFPEHGGSPATLMRAADEALYAAKRAGRDRWMLAAMMPAAPAPAPDMAEDLG